MIAVHSRSSIAVDSDGPTLSERVTQSSSMKILRLDSDFPLIQLRTIPIRTQSLTDESIQAAKKI